MKKDRHTSEDLKRENTRLKKTIDDLLTINELARLISSTMPVDEILDKVVGVSVKAANAEQGTISLLDDRGEEGDPFKTLVRKVDVSKMAGKYRLDMQLSGWMLKNRRALVINDVKKEPLLKVVDLMDSNIRSLLSVPLICKGKLTGILNVFNKKEGGEFSNDDQRLLSIIASQSSQVIENARLYEEEKQLRKFEQEMQMARRIQERLIPDTIPETDPFDVASFFSPADDVGGDYFDYFMLNENELALVMADVSGHGPSAALIMTMMKGVVHAITTEVPEPARILTDINVIMERIIPKETFVTMVFMILDLKTKTVRYSNAGHPPLVHYKAADEKSRLIELKGAAIGLTRLSRYQEEKIQLESGDAVFVYTDGVTETFDAQNTLFEESRLLEAVKDSGTKSASQIIQHVNKRLRDFSGTAAQSDDVAMIAIKVKEGSAS